MSEVHGDANGKVYKSHLNYVSLRDVNIPVCSPGVNKYFMHKCPGPGEIITFPNRFPMNLT